MKNLDQFKIAELIFHDLKEELSEADKSILKDWINESTENRELYNKIIDKNNIRNKIDTLNKSNTKEAWKKLNNELGEKKKIFRLNSNTILKYAVAACIVLLVGIYIVLKQTSKPEEYKLTESPTIVTGTQKAVLITSDNTKIALGDFKEGKTFNLKNAMVKDANNILTYHQTKEEPNKEALQPATNTLETPRGGEYSLVLSDGTRVYLNAETQLTFPEAFTADKREVLLEGEAYFEVAESKTKAFIVKTSDYAVQVYGTSFNVSAYASDKGSHTTLVSGSVGINTQTGTKVKLNPGEQAYYDKSDNSFYTKKVDTHVYTAWKEGKFMFENETLEEIMRKLGRWYDTKTVYLDKEIRNRHFSGTLDRYDNIADLLNMIGMTTRIEFKIERNIIYVNKKED